MNIYLVKMEHDINHPDDLMDLLPLCIDSLPADEEYPVFFILDRGFLKRSTGLHAFLDALSRV